jgi:hypothetical protein
VPHMQKGMAAPDRREPLIRLRPNSSTGGQLRLRLSSEETEEDLLSGGAHAFHETCVGLLAWSSAIAPWLGLGLGFGLGLGKGWGWG